MSELKYSTSRLSKNLFSSFLDKGICLVVFFLFYAVIGQNINYALPYTSGLEEELTSLTADIYDEYYATHLIEYDDSLNEISSADYVDDLLASLTKTSLIYFDSNEFSDNDVYNETSTIDYTSEEVEDFIYYYYSVYRVNNAEYYADQDETYEDLNTYFYAEIVKIPADLNYFSQISLDEETFYYLNLDTATTLGNYYFYAEETTEITETYEAISEIYIEALTTAREDFFENNSFYLDNLATYQDLYEDYAYTILLTLLISYLICAPLVYLGLFFVMKKYRSMGNKVMQIGLRHVVEDQDVKWYQGIIYAVIETIMNFYFIALAILMFYGSISIVFATINGLNVGVLSIIGIVLSLGSFVIYFVNKKHVGLAHFSSLMYKVDFKEMEEVSEDTSIEESNAINNQKTIQIEEKDKEIKNIDTKKDE